MPNPVVNTAAFTIEAWANMNAAGGRSNDNNPISFQRTETTGDGRTMTGLKSETNAYSNQNADFTIRGSDNATQTIFTPRRDYDEWHHYAGVVKPGSLYFYIDGSLVGALENLQDGIYNQNIEYTQIGRLRYNGLTCGMFNGWIDEVRIWSIPQSQEDIQWTMDTPLTGDENGLVALQNFNDGTATDQTENGNDGTFQGSAHTIEDNFFGSCDLASDVNGDELVDLVDLLLTVDYILERNPQPFFFWCADIIDDEEINITDIVTIIHTILGGG